MKLSQKKPPSVKKKLAKRFEKYGQLKIVFLKYIVGKIAWRKKRSMRSGLRWRPHKEVTTHF